MIHRPKSLGSGDAGVGLAIGWSYYNSRSLIEGLRTTVGEALLTSTLWGDVIASVFLLFPSRLWVGGVFRGNKWHMGLTTHSRVAHTTYRTRWLSASAPPPPSSSVLLRT